MSKLIDRDELHELFRYAYALAQDRETAQDLLQSALEKYLNRCNQGEVIVKKNAYLRTLIRNIFLDLCRSQKRWRYEEFDETLNLDITPLDLESVHINKDLLNNLWGQIEAVDRDILYHWAILEESIEQVALIINIPKGTILSRLHRLRKRLQSSSTVASIGG